MTAHMGTIQKRMHSLAKRSGHLPITRLSFACYGISRRSGAARLPNAAAKSASRLPEPTVVGTILTMRIAMPHNSDNSNSDADPFIGQQLGDYVIQNLLGQGGMARVYKGVDPNLNRI